MQTVLVKVGGSLLTLSDPGERLRTMFAAIRADGFLVVAGGGGKSLKLGKHIHCKTGTPLANLWLSQLQALGIDRKSYADSTGPLSEIKA